MMANLYPTAAKLAAKDLDEHSCVLELYAGDTMDWDLAVSALFSSSGRQAHEFVPYKLSMSAGHVHRSIIPHAHCAQFLLRGV